MVAMIFFVPFWVKIRRLGGEEIFWGIDHSRHPLQRGHPHDARAAAGDGGAGGQPAAGSGIRNPSGGQ